MMDLSIKVTLWKEKNKEKTEDVKLKNNMSSIQILSFRGWVRN